MPINFYFKQKITLKNRKQLKLFITSVFKEEAKSLSSLNYIFCNDEALLKINKQYLGHDYYTDIISFNLSETKAGPTIGEIYISTDRVKENASYLSVPLNQELHRVIFHGALHLCDYKDKTAKQRKLMRTKEEFYLTKYRLLP